MKTLAAHQIDCKRRRHGKCQQRIKPGQRYIAVKQPTNECPHRHAEIDADVVGAVAEPSTSSTAADWQTEHMMP